MSKQPEKRIIESESEVDTRVEKKSRIPKPDGSDSDELIQLRMIISRVRIELEVILLSMIPPVLISLFMDYLVAAQCLVVTPVRVLPRICWLVEAPFHVEEKDRFTQEYVFEISSITSPDSSFETYAYINYRFACHVENPSLAEYVTLKHYVATSTSWEGDGCRNELTLNRPSLRYVNGPRLDVKKCYSFYFPVVYNFEDAVFTFQNKYFHGTLRFSPIVQRKFPEGCLRDQSIDATRTLIAYFHYLWSTPNQDRWILFNESHYLLERHPEQPRNVKAVQDIIRSIVTCNKPIPGEEPTFML